MRRRLCYILVSFSNIHHQELFNNNGGNVKMVLVYSTIPSRSNQKMFSWIDVVLQMRNSAQRWILVRLFANTKQGGGSNHERDDFKNPSARSAAFARPDRTRSESLIRTNYRVLVIFRKIVKSQSHFFFFPSDDLGKKWTKQSKASFERIA